MHHERVADLRPARRRRVANASPTPCLARPHCLTCLQHRFLTSSSTQCNTSRADAAPTRRRCLDDEFPTHRERVAEAPTTRRIANALLGLSSTKFPHLAILAGRFVADASRTRRRRDTDASDATPTRRRRDDGVSPIRHRRIERDNV